MTDATDVIVSRSRDDEPLGAMVAGSAAAHVLLLSAALLFPVFGRTEQPPQPVMVISLAGGENAITPGMTQIGGRAVQEVAPPAPKPEPERPPAREEPTMTLPPEKPARKEPPRPKPEPRKAPEATERKPSTGAEVTRGNTPVETGARGVGFGLGSAGGGGGNASVQVDTDFCCSEYLSLMTQRIKQRWDQNQGVRGRTVMKFTIHRDGTIDDIEVERSSGLQVLDLAARRALALTTLPPLPPQYTNPTLTVHITFDYD